jgi:hypothetical protein
VGTLAGEGPASRRLRDVTDAEQPRDHDDAAGGSEAAEAAEVVPGLPDLGGLAAAASAACWSRPRR